MNGDALGGGSPHDRCVVHGGGKDPNPGSIEEKAVDVLAEWSEDVCDAALDDALIGNERYLEPHVLHIDLMFRWPELRLIVPAGRWVLLGARQGGMQEQDGGEDEPAACGQARTAFSESAADTHRSSTPRVFPLLIAGIPSVIQAGAGVPFRKWSKNCIILTERSLVFLR